MELITAQWNALCAHFLLFSIREQKRSNIRWIILQYQWFDGVLATIKLYVMFFIFGCAQWLNSFFPYKSTNFASNFRWYWYVTFNWCLSAVFAFCFTHFWARLTFIAWTVQMRSINLVSLVYIRQIIANRFFMRLLCFFPLSLSFCFNLVGALSPLYKFNVTQCVYNNTRITSAFDKWIRMKKKNAEKLNSTKCSCHKNRFSLLTM